MKVVSYLRKSVSLHAPTGFTLDSQREYIEEAAKRNGWKVVLEFVDECSSKISLDKRPGLQLALKACQTLGAPLVTAKLETLSRSAEKIGKIKELVEFKIATMPDATTTELHLHTKLKEQERRFENKMQRQLHPPQTFDFGARMKVQDAALELGRTKENRQLALTAINVRVNKFHETILPHLHNYIEQGISSFTKIAEQLNSNNIKTSRGGLWSATQVKRVMEALNLNSKID